MDRSEGDMMHYAATHGVKAPKVRALYDVMTKTPLARVLLSDLVQGDMITGIVDWEYSGFYPEYAGYAFAMVLCHRREMVAARSERGVTALFSGETRFHAPG